MQHLTFEGSTKNSETYHTAVKGTNLSAHEQLALPARPPRSVHVESPKTQKSRPQTPTSEWRIPVCGRDPSSPAVSPGSYATHSSVITESVAQERNAYLPRLHPFRYPFDYVRRIRRENNLRSTLALHVAVPIELLEDISTPEIAANSSAR